MTITIDLDTSYGKPYSLRVTGKNEKTVEVSIPKEFIHRQAHKAGLDVREYVRQYRAVAHYDDFIGVYYSFEKIENQAPLSEDQVTSDKS